MTPEDYKIIHRDDPTHLFNDKKGYHVFIDPGQTSANLGIWVLPNDNKEKQETINIKITDINLFNTDPNDHDPKLKQKPYAENDINPLDKPNVLHSLFLSDLTDHFALTIGPDLA